MSISELVDRRASALAELRSRITGEVLTRSDPGYDQHRLGWNRALEHDPAVVVVAADIGDVVAAVSFASSEGLGLGVQATGHGAVLPVGGVLLDTSRLTDVRIDPIQRTAWISAGCTWGPVLDEAQTHGLAPLLGSSTTVGAIGYTLGGGLGWLARHFGSCADSVRAFEVVTPDGQLVRAAADENADLFAALRGGGGGAFGVVTGMEIDLYPVTTVYAGNLLYPAEAAAEVVARYVEWVADAPDELTTSVVLMNFPPLPEIPEPIRGRSFTIVRGCWSGDLAAGRAVLDQWRATMPPTIDMWDVMPFAAADAISQDPVDPMPALTTGGWLDRFDAGVAEVLAERTFPTDGPPAVIFSEVRHVGGAVARGDRSATSMGHREREFAFHVVGAPMAVDLATVEAEVAATAAALGDALSRATYLNFLEGEERRARTADAVDPERHAALAELQRRLDPADVLRFGVDHRTGGRP
jgi:hypothetical protein